MLKTLIKTLIPKIQEYEYGNIYSSRSVVKNQYINKEQGGGYYGKDIWTVVNKELEGKIEQGVTIYGEIVGYLASGKAIQKGYDYGCNPSGECSGLDYYQHKFLVYRITYTKPNGEVIEFSWQQIKEYCKKYSIEHVKKLFFGTVDQFLGHYDTWKEGEFQNEMFYRMTRYYLERDCIYCKNKVPAEGVCVRIDGKPTYSTFKLKSKRFLEGESKAIDSGEVSIEDEQHEQV